MSLQIRMLLTTFMESFSTVLVERAVYFYCEKHLGFNDAENLWLALAFGGAYFFGAIASHSICRRTGEKWLLLPVVLAQAAMHSVMSASPGATVIVIGSTVLGFMNGLKWPIIESYLAAGSDAERTLRIVGRFNVGWAAAVPLSLAAAGPLIIWRPWALFALAGAVNILSATVIWPVPPRPAHVPDDHPHRPSAGELRRYSALLVSGRWLMLMSYSLMWILAAVMPHVFRGLEYKIEVSAGLSGLLDVTRLGAFVFLMAWGGWHGRVWPLAAALAVMPGAFFVVLFGHSLATVLAGELVFGLTAGFIYYSALYYALVVKNASVDAGGVHEGLIGLGFAVGPAAGLVGVALTPVVGSGLLGTLAGVGPVMLLCAVGGILPWRRLRGGSNGDP